MADRRSPSSASKFGFDEQMQRGLAWQRQSPQRLLLVQDVALAPASTAAGASWAPNRRGWRLVPSAVTRWAVPTEMLPTTATLDAGCQTG